MKLVVVKVVDHMTWGNCIPIDSVKSGDDHPILFIILGGTYTHTYKTNLVLGWLKL